MPRFVVWLALLAAPAYAMKPGCGPAVREAIGAHAVLPSGIPPHLVELAHELPYTNIHFLSVNERVAVFSGTREDGVQVAVKIPVQNTAENASEFDHEARMVTTINEAGASPTIPTFAKVHKTRGGVPYLESEFREGVDVATFFSESGAHDPTDAAYRYTKALIVYRRALDALDAVHRANGNFNSLMDEHLLVNLAGDVSLVGFANTTLRTDPMKETLDRAHFFHASPELMMGVPSDQRTDASDLYSLSSMMIFNFGGYTRGADAASTKALPFDIRDRAAALFTDPPRNIYPPRRPTTDLVRQEVDALIREINYQPPPDGPSAPSLEQPMRPALRR